MKGAVSAVLCLWPPLRAKNFSISISAFVWVNVLLKFTQETEVQTGCGLCWKVHEQVSFTSLFEVVFVDVMVSCKETQSTAE